MVRPDLDKLAHAAALAPGKEIADIIEVVGDKKMKRALNSNLRERVLAPENLRAAWKQVKQNDGAAGADGITIEAYPQWATYFRLIH